MICESTAEIDPGAAAADPAAGAEPPTAVRHGRRPVLTGVHGLLATVHQKPKGKHQRDEWLTANVPRALARVGRGRGGRSAVKNEHGAGGIQTKAAAAARAPPVRDNRKTERGEKLLELYRLGEDLQLAKSRRIRDCHRSA